MKLIFFISFYLVLILSILLTTYAQTTTIKPIDEEFDKNQSYCFRFTWLGPDYDNKTRYNATSCEDHFDKRDSRGIPCKQPLVITDNRNSPDIDYLWANHKNDVLCKRSPGKSCAKYSYSFNGALENVTYMCTKVFAKGEGAVRKGCFKQIINEYVVELCLCESSDGSKPCNSVSKRFINYTLLLFCYSLVNYLYHRCVK